MTKSKKWFSLLLTLVFCLGLIPAAALPARAAEEISTWASLYRKFVLGGEYILTSDVGFRTGGTFEDKDVKVPAGKEVVLDLRGHTIDRTDPEGISQGSVITVEGKLTIIDSSSNGTGRITGGNAAFGAGINVQPGGELILGGGFISGNASTWEGGGVYLASGADFTMNGGYIYENSAVECGGGVYLDSDSSLTMSDGTIFHNTATDGGGGIYLASGSSFTMSGGTVGNNIGGGVMDDGGSISLSGYPYISSNADFDGKALNLCLKEGAVVNAAGLSGGSIGVTAPWALSPQAFTAGLSNIELINRFQSDDPACAPIANSAGQATLGSALHVGGVDVTTANCGDVLGDGKVSYDSGSNTLTLNGAAIAAPGGGVESCGVEYTGYSDFTIVVTGTNTVTGSQAMESSAGIRVASNLIVTGAGTLAATGGKAAGSLGISCSSALSLRGSVSVTAAGGQATSFSNGVSAYLVNVCDSSSLTAVGGQAGSESYGINTGCGLNVEDNGSAILRTAADCDMAHASNFGLSIPSELVGLGSENPDGSGAVPYQSTDNDSYKFISIHPPYMGLYIAGVPVKDDYLSDSGWSYDPASNTLTLNSAAITDADGVDSYGIRYTGYSDFNLVVNGTNTVTAGTAANESVAVYSNGRLTVRGTGKLTATGGAGGKYSIGIYGGDELTITGSATVTAAGGTAADLNSVGISCFNATISGNASVTAIGGQAGNESKGVDPGRELHVQENGKLTAYAASTGTARALGTISVLDLGGAALASVNADGSAAEPYDADKNDIYKWFEFPALLSIRYSEKSLKVGESFQFTATGGTGGYTWRVGNTAIVTVDATGKVTGKVAGNTYLYCKDSAGTEVKCLLKIKAAPLSIRYAEKTVTVGVPFQFEATGGTGSYTWRTGNATKATVDATGKVTGKAAGNTYLYCKDSSGTEVKCLLKVVAPLSIRYAEKTVTVGVPFQFEATGGTGSYTWRTGNAAKATVDATGKVTGKAAGNTYLYCKDSSGTEVKCLLKIKAAPLSIRYAEKTVTVGVPFQFTATGGTSGYTWRVGNTDKATVDSTGKVTGKAAGNTYLYCKDSAGTEVKCLLKVVVPPSIRYSEKTISVGASFQFTATGGTGDYTWRVGNAAIATVDTTGKVTGKAVGNTYLYCQDDLGNEVRCLLKIKG